MHCDVMRHCNLLCDRLTEPLPAYRYGFVYTLLFANAMLNISPNLVRQNSILVCDRSCQVAESGVRDGVKATNVRDTGSLEDGQSLLNSRYLVPSCTCVIPFPLQAQRRGDVL